MHLINPATDLSQELQYLSGKCTLIQERVATLLFRSNRLSSKLDDLIERQQIIIDKRNEWLTY